MGHFPDHEARIDALVDGRLPEALARKDEDEIRAVLSEIGKAELANGFKKRIRPAAVYDGKPL